MQILDDLLQDEYNRILFKTPKADKAEAFQALNSQLLEWSLRLHATGMVDKQQTIARIKRSFPNKH